MLVDVFEVRSAVASDAIVPCFQPIFELRTGRLSGFEVLTRWQHSQLGLVLPGEFHRSCRRKRTHWTTWVSDIAEGVHVRFDVARAPRFGSKRVADPAAGTSTNANNWKTSCAGAVCDVVFWE